MFDDFNKKLLIENILLKIESVSLQNEVSELHKFIKQLTTVKNNYKNTLEAVIKSIL